MILNADKIYDPKILAFLAPVTGNYKFVFETKVLEEKNFTFRFAGRTHPEYKNGWTLKYTAPSDVPWLMVRPKISKILIQNVSCHESRNSDF